MADPANLLFILSDEHRRDLMGCAGSSVQTPNLDRLAREGTRFTQAYTPSPICVPARASLATGRHVHETRCWDSAHPWDGSLPGWGHELMAEGHDVVSIGKLHFRSSQDNNGFSEEIRPMHVLNGIGWTLGVIRDPLPAYKDAPGQLSEEVGSGNTAYTDYDQQICESAIAWLNDHRKSAGRPWVLFVSFVSPHFPLIAPAEFYDLHDAVTVGWPHRNGERPEHDALRKHYAFWNYADHFTDDAITKARRGYFGLTSFLDHNIGRLLNALEDNGLDATTRVLYSSDHGEMLGDHGMWTKQLMNEASAGVPMILRGPGVPANRAIDTPVSLVDCYPTILENAGHGCDAGGEQSGTSLFSVIDGIVPERTFFSEYHDGGSVCGYFMLRVGKWKFIHYAGYEPQLFDLEMDPMEDHDRARDPACRAVLAECESRLRDQLDPDAVNTLALADQAKRLADLGGRDAVLGMTDYEFGFTPVEAIEGTSG